MSESSAREFLERLNADEGYRAEVEQSVDGGDPTLASVAGRAARDGYEFTAGELEAVMRGMTAAGLEDAELDRISGGFNPQPTPPAMQSPADLMRDVLQGSVRLRF